MRRRSSHKLPEIGKLYGLKKSYRDDCAYHKRKIPQRIRLAFVSGGSVDSGKRFTKSALKMAKCSRNASKHHDTYLRKSPRAGKTRDLHLGHTNAFREKSIPRVAFSKYEGMHKIFECTRRVDQPLSAKISFLHTYLFWLRI